MLRGSLLAAALVPLLGFGCGAGHVRNGRIAYVHLGDNGNRFQIYTITASGAHRHPLTTSREYSSYAPAFAPRGKRIVFVRAYRQSDLWLMNADGRQKRDLTSTVHVDEIDPAWSPDGQEIAFAVESPSALDGIWVVGADGQGNRQLMNGDDTHPSWSPDGNTIAFQRYVRNADRRDPDRPSRRRDDHDLERRSRSVGSRPRLVAERRRDSVQQQPAGRCPARPVGDEPHRY